jgi:hypothetical protein
MKVYSCLHAIVLECTNFSFASQVGKEVYTMQSWLDYISALRPRSG